jgi:hypothetical protein
MGDANTSSVFSINNQAGQLGNGYSSYSAVLGASTSNAEILFTGTMSSFAATNLGGVLRWSDGNTWYKTYIDGGSIILQKRINGSYTILTSSPFQAAAGTSYTLRFRVTGTRLAAKAWQTGTTEPANWIVTASDSALSSGYCGLRAQIQAGTTATYTSFTATGL